ncbi:GNAT family N-acetyltransferase [Candidatus Oleimmundimicrobium sp.]|uniref:GNAT family N-acetyltransferase n=1 Tax=Candidatus Oleimmundimicrobium sp. TaxID=3060597 RepID=UPI00271F8FD7|nr:GNAT family N-acetyltransferase [Candidatus Oleimmundimicrobium sp.]MDO8885892.1 GNAT family N-acetyltransferase [Candidatus Oleimmundimicrobium sp.]
MKIDVITTKKEFEAIKEKWDALLANSSGSIFQTWEWQWVWWKHYAKDKKLFILVATEKDLIGIAPFYLSRSYYGLPIKVLSFLGTGPSDYGDFIVLPGKEEKFIKGLFKYLSTTNVDWDIVDLQQLLEDSPCINPLRASIKEGGLNGLELFQESSFALLLPSSRDELMGTLSKKFRYNLNYYPRRLFKQYKVDSYNLNDRADDITFGMNLFFDLHQKRWQKKKLPGLFWNKRYRDFHSDIAALFHKKGWLALYFLKLDDEMAASLYGFKYNNCFYYYLSGFDPRWERFSVGTFIVSEAIRDSITKKLSCFDFLRGTEEYKLKWGAASHSNMRFLLCKKDGYLKGAPLLSRPIMQFLSYETKFARKAKERLRRL